MCGKVIGESNRKHIGKSIKVKDQGDSIIAVKSNQVITLRFEQADYSKHLCHLLKEAKLPPREVEDFEIYHIDRRLFNGDTAI